MDESNAIGSPAPRTRRAALRTGGVAAAALAAFGAGRVAAQSATPLAGGARTGSVLAQGFVHGTLFRTQGSGPNLLPYTIIVWGAIGGFAFFDRGSGAAGILPADRVVDALGAANPAPDIVLIASPAKAGDPSGAGEQAWALTLGYAGLGQDPDAVTYQGALLDPADAMARFGLAPSPPPSLV
ncbi:MAG TPA: hypothetical protein VFI22_02260 [Thermomicrobiales bacterium]|nr:hypothetical protein [Thermomicrobiales bacterium]